MVRSYFLGPHFIPRLYHFRVEHNFILELDSTTGKQIEKAKNRSPVLNKMIGVPGGTVENDPNPSRVVIARFEETERDLVLKYYTIGSWKVPWRK